MQYFILVCIITIKHTCFTLIIQSVSERVTDYKEKNSKTVAAMFI